MTTGLSDAQEIDNLLSDTTYDSVKFNDATWGYLTDINNLSYQDRVIFSTTVLKQQLVDYNSAFITVPMQVTRAQIIPSSKAGDNTTPAGGANTTFTAPYDYVSTQVPAGCDPGVLGGYLKGNQCNEPLLAFRDSILNTFCGLIVQTDNGQAIVNEYGRLDLINNLRLKIENSTDWMQTMGSLLHFSLDTVANSYYTGIQQPYSVSGGVLASGIQAPLSTNFVNNSVNPFLPDANLITGNYSTWPNTTDVTATMAQGNFAPHAVGASMPLTYYILQNIAIAPTSATTSTVTGTSTVFTASMVGGVLQVGPNQYLITGYTSATSIIIGTGGVTVSATQAWNISFPSGASVPLVASVAVPNPGYNKGLNDRIQFFQNASTYTAPVTNSTVGSFSLVAKIPLRLLHDFFEQLDFPIINVGFNIQLILRQPNNQGGASAPAAPLPYQGIPPLQTGQLYGANGTTPYALWTTGAPAIQYGAGVQTALYGQGCRLYYRSIKLNPTENDAFKSKLLKGFTKKIKFISTDSYYPTQAVYSKTGNSFQIAPSIVWPLRVWVMLYSNGTPNSQNITAQSGSLAGNWGSGGPSSGNVGQAAQCGLQVTHGWMTNANISVNNQPYFKTPLMTPDDFWLQFKDQLNRNTGCMISYQDFITKFRYHVFDLSRLSDRLPSKTESCSLVLNFDRQDVTGGACDMVVMIERMNQVQMDFASSDVTITVGNITA